MYPFCVNTIASLLRWRVERVRLDPEVIYMSRSLSISLSLYLSIYLFTRIYLVNPSFICVSILCEYYSFAAELVRRARTA